MNTYTALTQVAATTPLDTGNTAWMLMAASLVLFMTIPGLALFYGGLGRSKGVLNMMMMSFGSFGLIGILYVLYGYSMSFGTKDIGGLFAGPFEFFGLKGLIPGEPGAETITSAGIPALVFVGFQFTFAAITVALISGAIADRVKFSTWMVFSALWVTLAYFPLAHMVWGGGLLSGSESGVAAKLFGTTDGAASVAPIDFAGGTVVHINAGMAGLVLALLVGKRIGFDASRCVRTTFRWSCSVPESCGSAGSVSTQAPRSARTSPPVSHGSTRPSPPAPRYSAGS